MSFFSRLALAHHPSGPTNNNGSMPSYVARIIPARTTPPLDLAALETTVQALVLDQQVLALELASLPSGTPSPHAPGGAEIAGTSEGPQTPGVQFLLRASSEHALHAAMHQLQAHYPQARIERLSPDKDPFHLQEQEQVHVIELRAGGAAYESLRTWSSRGQQEPGTDPLLGLLPIVSAGSIHASRLRVITQLTLLPLAPQWSRRYQRLAVEHPLEEEREQRRHEWMRLRRGVPGWEQLLLLGLLVVVLVAWDRLHLQRLLPSWLREAGQQVVHGTLPPLTSLQQLLLMASLLMSMGLILLLLRGMMILSRAITTGGTRYYDMRRLAEKINKSAYRARLRLYVIAEETGKTTTTPTLPTREEARRVRQAQRVRDQQAALIAAYRQFQTATAYFVPRRLPSWLAHHLLRGGWHTRSPLTLVGYSDLLGRLRGKGASCFYLSGAEVGTLWHLPPGADLAQAAGVEQRQEHSLLVPHALTTGSGWRLGYSTHAGISLPVSFPLEALLKHKVLLGRTGSGKSTLFEHLALASQSPASTPHPGLCIIEPHGDLVHDVLALLPTERCNDVVLLDLAQDQGRPIGLNPLDATQITSTEEADLLVSHLLTTFKGIWVGAWGPRVENVMRFSLKALMEANGTLIRDDPHQGPSQQYTLLDLLVLLKKQSFRHRLLDQVHDLHVLDWWHQFYERLDVKIQDEITTPVLTKISAYASSPSARRLLGQPTSTIDFVHVVEQQQILLVNTASGQVGQDVSSLVGASLLGLFTAALSRQLSRPLRERHPFLVCVDEFRNYPINYAYVLSELRKANTFLALATQSLAQLDAMDPLLRPIVFANADHLFIFPLAGEDAHLLRHELGQALTPEDVVTLPDYTCYARWSLRGQRLPFFSLTLDRPPQGQPEHAQRLREQCAMRYGVPVAHVDATLEALLARHGSRPHATSSTATLASGVPFLQSAQMGDTDAPEKETTQAAQDDGGAAKRPMPSQAQSASGDGAWEEDMKEPASEKPRRVRIRRRSPTSENTRASSPLVEERDEQTEEEEERSAGLTPSVPTEGGEDPIPISPLASESTTAH